MTLDIKDIGIRKSEFLKGIIPRVLPILEVATALSLGKSPLGKCLWETT